uniref:Secreted protein n=1 Tax=Hordeum vulgare subsp. vulgare TaxID=112509 RepID=A0A8I6WCE7_HORVV
MRSVVHRCMLSWLWFLYMCIPSWRGNREMLVAPCISHVVCIGKSMHVCNITRPVYPLGRVTLRAIVWRSASG